MSYQILNPVSHPVIGWHRCNMFGKYKGVTIRECDNFDKEHFGAEFRIARPYEPEYKTTEDGIQQNPLYWSRPARTYKNGVEYWESDGNEENGRWLKLRGNLEIKGWEAYTNLTIGTWQ